MAAGEPTYGRARDGGFRWRGGEVSRLEALSDAVFGFAITLLVVSLEVPQTYAQLTEAMRGFVSFAASFSLLFLVWFHQYRFFRRFGLQDTTTVVLNAVLLFLVVFFVYPLKFVFTLVVNETMGRRYAVLPDGSHVPVFTDASQPGQMMVVFGTGYVAVFALFALLYLHAYRRRASLDLDAREAFETVDNVRQNVLNAAVGLLSIAVAMVLPARSAALSGTVYMLIGPVLTANGFYSGWRQRKLGILPPERADAPPLPAEGSGAGPS